MACLKFTDVPSWQPGQQRGGYRGSGYSLQVQKQGFSRLQNFENCLTTVYSFTFLSSTVYKQKLYLILQCTSFKMKPITVYRISINTPLSMSYFKNVMFQWNIKEIVGVYNVACIPFGFALYRIDCQTFEAGTDHIAAFTMNSCVIDNIEQPSEASDFKISHVTPCLGNSYDTVEFITA